ncbi:MAG: carbon-nitrogen hydrolase, partial [Chloroflexi bacterium]|nr:carbon-nitrogen hydrolase [Chloroflexota bacterium]
DPSPASASDALLRLRPYHRFNEKTIVVLPEYIGTWLVVVGENQRVYRAASIARAMRALVLSNLFSFIKTLPSAEADDAVKYALFRMKAAQMAEVYHDAFSRLAQKHAVTVVAGSILLPSPGVSDGRLTIGDGPLYNVCVVYEPGGAAHESVVRKAFPIEAEQPFTARASVAELPVFDTPAGRLGVLICADSWYPSSYEILKAQRADFVAVPSYLSPSGVWGKPWRGYDGAPAPGDVDARDVNRLTEGEAWLKYALAGRLAEAGIKHGINVFLRGDLWDLGSDGHTIIVEGPTVMEAKHVTGAAIVNFWLS